MNPEVYRRMADHQAHHWWFAARRRLLETLIDRHRPIQSEPLEILEIGCGPGGNLDMLSRFGKLSAMEMDEYALGVARQLAPTANVQPGWLPDRIPFGSARFDLICLFDVLEHIEDDTAALAAIFQLARPGSIVILTVPAYQWLYGEHDRAHRHLRRYTAKSLGRLALKQGFRVRRLGYFNTFLFPLVALARTIGRIAGTAAPPDDRLPPAFMNRLLYRIFAAEAAILKIRPFPFGVSALAILERP